MDIVQFRSQFTNLVDKSEKEVFDFFTELFTYHGYKPDVIIDGDFVRIHINTTLISGVDSDFKKGCDLCNSEKYREAETYFKRVVEKCPAHADAYRSWAQAKMMQGELDEAIDINISALKYDETNLWALILMGNLLAKQGNADGALTYYNKVLKYHDNDVIALNNVATAYLQLSHEEEAIDLYKKVIALDKSYINSYYGLALIYDKRGLLEDAFNILLDGAKNSIIRKENPHIVKALHKFMLEIASKLVKMRDFWVNLNLLKTELEKRDLPITFTPKDLKVKAQLRYAPTRNKNYHEVIYNSSNSSFVNHSILHELMHLEMNISAKEKSNNKIAYSSIENKNKFFNTLGSYRQKLQRKLSDSTQVNKILDDLITGILLQVSNCGLDMLVEDKIFNEHEYFRPLQLLSLFDMNMGNIESVNQAMKTIDMFPQNIVSANKVMNMVSAMHFKSLYGIDLLENYKYTKAELTKAENIFEEYLCYRNEGYQPGEEYNLTEVIAEELNLDDFISLENENCFIAEKQNIINEIREKEQQHPLEERIEQNDSFREQHVDGANDAETMMMSMYMLGALQEFEKMSIEEIKIVAFDIAILGMNGITPDKQGYSVKSLGDREFGGYQMLAYYYVSWAIAIPEKLNSLGLPFSKAYELAKQMFEK